MGRISWARSLRALTVGVTLVLAFAQPLAAAERFETAKVARVIDGDTFVLASGARVRVRNFDTPELRRYDCREERAKAVEARDAARRILQGRTVTLRITGRDRYKREVADVAVHQGPRTEDFVARMVADGHGARWRYGREPQPDWCPAAAEAKSKDAWRVVWNAAERAITRAVLDTLR